MSIRHTPVASDARDEVSLEHAQSQLLAAVTITDQPPEQANMIIKTL